MALGKGRPMFLVLSRYLKSTEDVDRVLPEHRAFLDRHYASGEFIVSGPMEPRVGGVILTADMPRIRLDTLMAQDPFVREEISSYEIVEFRATKQQEWFTARLAGS